MNIPENGCSFSCSFCIRPPTSSFTGMTLSSIPWATPWHVSGFNRPAEACKHQSFCLITYSLTVWRSPFKTTMNSCLSPQQHPLDQTSSHNNTTVCIYMCGRAAKNGGQPVLPASICLHWITVWGGVSLPSNRTSLHHHWQWSVGCPDWWGVWWCWWACAADWISFMVLQDEIAFSKSSIAAH